MECNTFLIAKILIIFALCCGFFITTFNNFKDFISNKTTMSTYVESFEKLPMPAITVCNKTAFKNYERNVEWDDYMENTLNLTDFFRKWEKRVASQNIPFNEFVLKGIFLLGKISVKCRQGKLLVRAIWLKCPT